MRTSTISPRRASPGTWILAATAQPASRHASSFTTTSTASNQKLPSESCAIAVTRCVPFSRSRDSISARPLSGPRKKVATSGTGFLSAMRSIRRTWSASLIGLSTLTVMPTECPFSATGGSSSRTRPLRMVAPLRMPSSVPCGVLSMRASTPGAGLTLGCASARRGSASSARSAARRRRRPMSSAQERQLADALARRCEDRVGDRWGDRRGAGLAHASGRFLARHDVHLDLGHLVHPQHPVVVEVRLLHLAVLERDLAVQGGGQPVDDRALDLALHDIGVRRHAAVDRRDDAVDLWSSVRRDRDLGDLRAPAAEGEHHRDAAEDASGKRLAPVRLLRGELERTLVAWRLAQER